MAARHFMKRSTLSPTETGIAACLIDGMSDREIAAAMGTSHRTVGAHLMNMRGKTGLTTRGLIAMLAVMAWESRPEGKA